VLQARRTADVEGPDDFATARYPELFFSGAIDAQSFSACSTRASPELCPGSNSSKEKCWVAPVAAGGLGLHLPILYPDVNLPRFRGVSSRAHVNFKSHQ
jgi:hypothetical protein